MVIPSDKPSVLIVEDEFGSRNSLKQILQPGFQIFEAGTGQEALNTLRTNNIDLITLDQKLPDVEGIDLLRNIKQERTNVEVIIITAYGSLQSAMEGMRFGIAGYLLKPFNVTELTSLIQQTLDKKTRLDLLREALQHSKHSWEDQNSVQKLWREMEAQYTSIAEKTSSTTQPPWLTSKLTPFLSELIEAFNRDLFHHGNRVSFYSTVVGNHLNFGEAEQEALALGGLIHDIGYLGDGRVWEPGSDESSHSESKKGIHHTEIGLQFTSPLHLSAEVRQIISFHHEWFDGSRSLHGLRGGGIPYNAQIIGIANVFDHLRMEHSGRPGLSVKEAFLKLKSFSDTRFSPFLIKHFIKALESGSSQN